MPRTSFRGPLPPMDDQQRELSANLRRHVDYLATTIGPRNIWTPGSMLKTATYIQQNFDRTAYPVTLQEYSAYNQKSLNIQLEIKGAGNPEQIIIIGAHYDTVLNSPGANDNASGVAALLELARLLTTGGKPARTLRLVAFANEEPPFYYGKDMGSSRYAKRCREQQENIVAMLSLETMGMFSEQPGSQHYPFPLNFFYPDTGNFIAFAGNLGSRALVRKTIGAFRQNCAFPSEGVAAPELLTGIGWSDHWSFWQEGYPALMVTDTAFFRSDNYHTPSDTANQLDYDKLARVTAGLAATITELAVRRSF
ncbi:MAG TPA: M20/M25/M40 family metallo-hydrolase [Deltaproteobacteria bacterium]|nr:M20/M25/M40 family metallo-hydrolase [Deltaproteobacteria bacterium]